MFFSEYGDGGIILSMDMPFKLIGHDPQGDQREAIDTLVRASVQGMRAQTLLGVTVRARRFTMARSFNVCSGSRWWSRTTRTPGRPAVCRVQGVFSENAVETLSAITDYYSRGYIPSMHYIDKVPRSTKRSTDRIRPRPRLNGGCIVVASVSCIYGLATPRLPGAEVRCALESKRPGTRSFAR